MWSFFKKKEKPKKVTRQYIQQMIDVASLSKKESFISKLFKGGNQRNINEILAASHKRMIEIARHAYINNPYIRKSIYDHIRGILPLGGLEYDGSEASKNVLKDIQSREWQQLALLQFLRDGEVFVRRIRKRNRLEIEIIDSLRVPSDIYRDMGVDEKTTRVYKLDANGWQSQSLEDVPNVNILHAYVKDFPAQKRGIPFNIAGLEASEMLYDYIKNYQQMCNLAAANHIYLTQVGGEMEMPELDEDIERETSPVSFNGNEIPVLPPNMDIKSLATQYPSGSYSAFLKSNISYMAAALDEPEALLTGNYGHINFSAGKLMFRKEYDRYQFIGNLFIDKIMNPVSNWLLEYDAIKNGSAITLGKYNVKKMPIIDTTREATMLLSLYERDIITKEELRSRLELE